ncbi:GPR1/FUN34/YaaH-class plasma membrane protein [Penicillium verhagenii]|uniref:GPR1/FUN34/YaaH-class plasma membrane protein n=1 Tax=Penicillium verhagenii TaxID=1562060 RepID=UPI0025452B1F|nr:GPR1/FUN34/YaaH-class plasma membrane protein [Penicillium verhagenii]KAJ5917144.1 GPR1/FUN34/YaaH-class plasma membrane protein [Penicillium verhagenii]
MHDEIMRGSSKISHSEAGGMPVLTQVPTSVTLSAEQFERLYLSPMMHRQPTLAKNLGNPTPLGVGAFVLTATPLACCLMGWRGAGGGGAAFSGVLILLGGLLLVLSSILEFILGNTFSSVVFGGFCLAFGATMTPAFNSAAPYSADGTNTLAGLHGAGFVDTFVCATRTNLVFVLKFTSLVFVFSLLAAAYWKLGLEDEAAANRLTVGAGVALFVATMLGFYLLTAQLLDSVGFPLSLPVGDLSGVWNRRSQRNTTDPELATDVDGKF